MCVGAGTCVREVTVVGDVDRSIGDCEACRTRVISVVAVKPSLAFLIASLAFLIAATCSATVRFARVALDLFPVLSARLVSIEALRKGDVFRAES